MVNVDVYSAIIAKISNALNTLMSGEMPGFQALSKGLSPAVRGVPDHGAVQSECSAGVQQWIADDDRAACVCVCVQVTTRVIEVAGQRLNDSDASDQVHEPDVVVAAASPPLQQAAPPPPTLRRHSPPARRRRSL